MHNEKMNVLGISMGTRRIGVAIVSDVELVEWHVKVFRGQWGATKLHMIKKHLEKLAVFYGVQVVAMKLPSQVRSSLGLRQLTRKLRQLCERNSITIKEYTLAHLKDYCFPGTKRNKSALIEHVATRYPEVYAAGRREWRNRNPHYTKMFEAIAAADLCHKHLAGKVEVAHE
jgi:hypothetical protein